MKLSQLFQKLLYLDYQHVENDGSFYTETQENTLRIFLQDSNGETDWINNFDFPAKPYKDMGTVWYCHRGFLKVWKSIEPYLTEKILNPNIKEVEIAGYSHGGALAVLAHEYVWFNRPDLRGHIKTICFEPPKVFYGIVTKELKERWEGLTIYQNQNDLITYLPPSLLGFNHVVKPIKIGQGIVLNKYRKLNCLNAHYSPNVLLSLKDYEKKNNI